MRTNLWIPTLILTFLFTSPARAVITEPDNLVWGNVLIAGKVVSAKETNIVVEARRSLTDAPLASYRMGDNGAAGDFYSLAIPLESVNPISGPAATRTGETILVLVHNGQFVRYVTLYTVGERGKILRLDLGDVDADNNGLIDNWERQYFNGVGQDPNGDPDHDGVSNRDEMLGATNPLVPDARHPADTSPTNNIITIGEVTAYALAWKTGKPWPVAPTNIPVEFVARAGFLWKNGERYIMDTNNLAAGAPLWWTNLPPDTNVTGSVAPASFSPTRSALAKKSEIKSVAGHVNRYVTTAASTSEPTVVTLLVQPGPNTSAYGLEESLPDGWSASEISGDGVFDAASHRLRWGLFLDHEERTLSYRVQAASPNLISKQLSGNASFDGWVVQTAGTDILLPDSNEMRLSAPVLRQNNEVIVKLAGEAWQRYQIQVSSDLLQWTTLTTEMADRDGQLEFKEHFEHLDRQRFYRARRVEE